MATTLDPFRSARLIYRAAEVEAEADRELFRSIQQDFIAYQNSTTRITKPQPLKSVVDFLKDVAEEMLLGVIICLPSPDAKAATPIGMITLEKVPPRLAQHRRSEIGVSILKAYQGQGYGSETMKWVLQWAFLTAGLHRVALHAFS